MTTLVYGAGLVMLAFSLAFGAALLAVIVRDVWMTAWDAWVRWQVGRPLWREAVRYAAERRWGRSPEEAAQIAAKPASSRRSERSEKTGDTREGASSARRVHDDGRSE
jgi:hypothetical protein